MKYCLGIGMWLLAFCAAAQQTEVWSRVEIRTSLPVKEYLETPWRNSISEETAQHFLQPLLQLIDSGVISVCRPEAPFNLPLSKKEIHNLLHQYDTMNAENYQTGMWDTVIVIRDLYWDEIRSLDFREKWELDPVNGVFNKKVTGVIFRKAKFNKVTGEYMGSVPLFYLAFNMSSVKDPSRWKNSSCRLFHVSETPLQLVDPGDGQKQNMDKMHSMLTPFLMSASTAYDTTYPYCIKLPAKKLKALVKDRAVISDYLICEHWNLNLGTFSFDKIVTSIVFQMRYINSLSAFTVVHLNKFMPQPLLQNDKRYPVSEYGQSLLFEQVPLNMKQYWYPVSGLDSAATGDFFHEVGEKALKGIIPCFTTKPVMTLMDSAMRDHAFVTRDTLWVEGWTAMEQQISEHFFQNEYPMGMKASEQWFFDPAAATFSKNVSYFGATYQFREFAREEPYEVVSNYYVKNNALSPGNPLILGKKVHYLAYLDQWLDQPIEDSVRLVPLFNGTCFLTTMQKYQVVQGLIHTCVEGKLTSLDPVTGRILKKNEVLAFLRSRIDSLAPTGHLQPEFKAVDHLEFEENWYRYEGTTDIRKEVISVTLIDMKTKIVDDKETYEPKKLLKIQFKTPEK